MGKTNIKKANRVNKSRINVKKIENLYIIAKNVGRKNNL